jgi:hypothetical protein
LATYGKNSTLQTAILWEICHALKHNFFADIAAQLPSHLHHASTGRHHPRRPHCRAGAGNSPAKSQKRIADGGSEREMIFDKK